VTAPNYTDKDVVGGLSRQNIKELADPNYGSEPALAKTALLLWKARDSARQTAALQDAAIHKALPRMMILEKLAAAVKSDYGKVGGDYCDCSIRFGHPMISEHSPACRKINKLLKRLDALTQGRVDK